MPNTTIDVTLRVLIGISAAVTVGLIVSLAFDLHDFKAAAKQEYVASEINMGEVE